MRCNLASRKKDEVDPKLLPPYVRDFQVVIVDVRPNDEWIDENSLRRSGSPLCRITFQQFQFVGDALRALVAPRIAQPQGPAQLQPER